VLVGGPEPQLNGIGNPIYMNGTVPIIPKQLAQNTIVTMMEFQSLNVNPLSPPWHVGIQPLHSPLDSTLITVLVSHDLPTFTRLRRH
jgi:hypothetical protein